MSQIVPFQIQIPDADLQDLKTRLARTRWAEAETVSDWSQGIPLAYVKEVCEYWASKYDWRERERKLNRFPQFKTKIDGLDIHFIHVKSPVATATPLVMTHGWPGSIVEFQKVIAPLADPVAHGGKAEDAFHVVCPSLPGYGFSEKPTSDGLGHRQDRRRLGRADVAPRLPQVHRAGRRLGLDGDDLHRGAASRALHRDPSQHGDRAADRGFAEGPDASSSRARSPAWTTTANATAAIRSSSRRDRRRSATGSSIRRRARRPGSSRSSGAGPIATATRRTRSRRDEMLDNVMLYWLPATGASSARLYWESFNSVPMQPIEVPVGVSVFPHEIFKASRRWCEARYAKLVHHNVLDEGGTLRGLRAARDLRRRGAHGGPGDPG